MFLDNVASQSASCEFEASYDYGYTCHLTLIDVDESTQITGQHLDGKNDESVRLINTIDTHSSSAKIPHNLCEKFKNAQVLSMIGIGLEEIDEKSFKNCENLKVLKLSENKIKKLSEKSFESQSKLTELNLSANKLTELHQQSFANMTSLTDFDLRYNNIKILPSGIFSPLIDLENLWLSNNKLKTLEYSWFGDDVQKLKILTFDHNKINAIDEDFISNMPELMKIRGHSNTCTIESYEYVEDINPGKPRISAYLSKCFNNYEVFAFIEMKIDEKVQKIIDKIEKLNENCRTLNG